MEKIEYKENTKSKKKIWLIGVLVLVLCCQFGLFGYAFVSSLLCNKTYDEFREENGIIKVSKDLKISNVNGFYDSESKSYYVEGYLENSSNKDITSLSVDYKIYDNDKVLLGSASAYVDNLEKNSKWKFKAVYDEIDANEAARYKLMQVYVACE